MKNTETAVTLENKTVSMANQPLRDFVQQTLENYFQRLDANMPPTQLYDLVLEEVEAPLLKATLTYTRGNQCKASILLGISRSTLRKKLKIYGLENK